MGSSKLPALWADTPPAIVDMTVRDPKAPTIEVLALGPRIRWRRLPAAEAERLPSAFWFRRRVIRRERDLIVGTDTPAPDSRTPNLLHLRALDLTPEPQTIQVTEEYLDEDGKEHSRQVAVYRLRDTMSPRTFYQLYMNSPVREQFKRSGQRPQRLEQGFFFACIGSIVLALFLLAIILLDSGGA